jgi:hypothetical protein
MACASPPAIHSYAGYWSKVVLEVVHRDPSAVQQLGKLRRGCLHRAENVECGLTGAAVLDALVCAR